MAEAFKNAYKDVTTSYSAIYTCPASTEAVVKSLLTIEVPANSRIDLCADSLIFLEADDDIQLLASATGDLEAFISVLQIT